MRVSVMITVDQERPPIKYEVHKRFLFFDASACHALESKTISFQIFFVTNSSNTVTNAACQRLKIDRLP